MRDKEHPYRPIPTLRQHSRRCHDDGSRLPSPSKHQAPPRPIVRASPQSIKPTLGMQSIAATAGPPLTRTGTCFPSPAHQPPQKARLRTRLDASQACLRAREIRVEPVQYAGLSSVSRSSTGTPSQHHDNAGCVWHGPPMSFVVPRQPTDSLSPFACCGFVLSWEM
ncbi:hypothetical protein BU23DRAFT_559348, partial [Bimuria novae-zelandiae CBS 107.79]